MKGGDKMPDEVRVELETQRLLNLVRGFGWERVEQVVDEKGIKMVLRKELPSEMPVGPEKMG